MPDPDHQKTQAGQGIPVPAPCREGLIFAKISLNLRMTGLNARLWVLMKLF